MTTATATATAEEQPTVAQKGEEAAARFLYRRGYEILERHYLAYAGVMDIIAKDGDTLVFVNVDTQEDATKGFPKERLTSTRCHRLENIALEYLSDYPEARDCTVRFDTVGIVVVGKDRALIRHHINTMSSPSLAEDLDA